MEGPTEKCLKLGSLIKYHNYCHRYYYFHWRNEYESNLYRYECYLIVEIRPEKNSLHRYRTGHGFNPIQAWIFFRPYFHYYFLVMKITFIYISYFGCIVLNSNAFPIIDSKISLLTFLDFDTVTEKLLVSA